MRTHRENRIRIRVGFVEKPSRSALRSVRATRCVQFFTLNIKAPDRMRPAKAYFYLDVTGRAQSIDWDRSETGPRVVRAPDGGESRAVGGPVVGPWVKFKPVTAEIPKIWREADVDRPDVHFFHNKRDEFMRDDLWEELNARFPGQLVAKKLG